jgi:cob(I)alamin adenosyltransferase
MVASQTKQLEEQIDLYNKDLQPLKSFVLNGGTAAAAALHLARTVARRAERLMVALGQQDGEHLNAEAVRYINRLSDFLFVAARACNDNGNADVLWVPGKNR